MPPPSSPKLLDSTPTIPAAGQTVTCPNSSSAAPTTNKPVIRSSSGSDSREDSGGAGNESDDEREPSGSGSGEQISTREDSDEQGGLPRLSHLSHHEMYPFPSTLQRHSSAEVEASSAGSMSSFSGDDDQEEEEDNEDVKMSEPKVVAMPKRTLSEYRASLSRAGLAAPPKIRRLGALGISVHSESDIENPQVSGLDTNDRIDPASGGDTSAGTRETDLGVSFAALQTGTGSVSPVTEIKSPKKRKRGIADATFRGIVDELAIENRQLKDKLRRYEAHGVPVELKDSRLFEIRFYDGLPIDQRTELESFLTTYVRDFVGRGPLPSSSSSPPRPAKTSRPTVRIRPISPRLQQQEEEGFASLPSPQHSETFESKSGPRGLPPLAADSSNSGVEPFSLSGVGSGVYRPTRQSFSDPARSFSNPSLPSPAILTEQDRQLAKSVITSLEQLFRRSLRQNKEEEPREESAKRSRSNETYMANFLSHDFLSDGWVYLNLASTMAELHRYSVTLNFVQQAVRNHSSNLEVSEDGKRVRWTGPSPEPSPPPSRNASISEPQTQTKQQQPRAVKIASPAPTDSQVSSGGVTSTTTTQDSLSSTDPSSDNLKSSQVANSIAPTASTAPTSQAPSRGTHSGPTKTMTRPQRPTAAVLQRMDRLSPPTNQQLEADSQMSPPKQKQNQARQHLSNPQRPLSFVAHPDSSLRKAPEIYHRLLRNKTVDETEYADEDLDGSRLVIPRDPGMLVFYANGHFCSDLTQEEATPHEVDVDQPFVLGGGFDNSPDAGSDFSDSPSMNIDLDDDVELVGLNYDSQNGNFDAGEEEKWSVDSQDSSIRRLAVSGMTSTIPADLFTILVKMKHPQKRSRTEFNEPTSPKKRRLTSQRPRILSSKAFHHRPIMTKRSCPIEFDDSSSGDEVGRPHLTASNLAKHTHPTLAAITPPLEDDIPGYPTGDTPSPPHDDYLLSLGAPLHAWAPRETNIASRDPPVPPRSNLKNRLALHRRLAQPYPARTLSEMSTTTGDERPISLDDPVGPASLR
ncbi:uncharacterized protein JCM6883_003018 [Sporobolomyces salmoneus]|uniref:uncharacterized protein n=1 Tax=Sporobolomyces salmoneus TaxID=183962 RepID=UPI003174DCEE